MLHEEWDNLAKMEVEKAENRRQQERLTKPDDTFRKVNEGAKTGCQIFGVVSHVVYEIISLVQGKRKDD